MKNTKPILIVLVIITLLSCSKNDKKEKKIRENIMVNQQMTKSDAMKLVKPFYDFLGGNVSPDKVMPSYHKDWISYYNNTQGRSMEETVGFISGPLAQMIPDLNWEIIELYITSNNTIVVRGEATGTPVGDSFMGTAINGGKSFKFMSIDIHELKDGKILKTYHVEDWINAIQQISLK